MLSPEAVHSTLLGVLADGMRELADSSMTAAAFARDPGALSREVLVRHALEHVFRIRMFRSLDTLAEHLLRESHDTEVAEAWARYSRSESVHDRYFLRDLAAAGVPRATVDGMQPFPSTQHLGRFVESAALEHGPLAVVLYSFWAEESSDIGTRPIIERARVVLGEGMIRGAMAHRMLDENQDHGGVIAGILVSLIPDDDTLLLAARLLGVITSLIGQYFSELDAWSTQQPRATTEALALA